MKQYGVTMKKLFSKKEFLLPLSAILCLFISSFFPFYTLGQYTIFANKLFSFILLFLLIFLVLRYKLFKSPLFWVFAVFLSFIFITAFLESSDLLRSFGGEIPRIWFMYLLALVVGFLLDSEKRKLWLAGIFSLSLVITSVLYVSFLINAITTLFSPSIDSSMKYGVFRLGRLHAFGNANILGIYAATSVLEAFWLFVFFAKSKFRFRHIICVLCSLLGMLSFLMLGLCRSRGSILAVAAGVGAMVFILIKSGKAFVKPFLAACLGAVLSIALCLGLQKSFDLAVVSSVSEKNAKAEMLDEVTPVSLDYALDTLSDRTLIWSATIRMLDEEPMRWITGITAANVHPNQIYDVYEGRPELTIHHAHSGYMEVLLEYGLPGACFLLIVLIEIITACFRLVFSTDWAPKEENLVIGFIAATLVLGFVEVLPFPYSGAYILAFLFFICSGCCLSLAKDKPCPHPLRITRFVAYGCFILCATVLCLIKSASVSKDLPSNGPERIAYFNDKNRKSISAGYVDFALEDIADIFNGEILGVLITDTAPGKSYDNVDMNLPRTVDCRFGISVTRTSLYKLPVSSDDENMLQSDVLPFTPFVELYDSIDGDWSYVLTYGYGGWIKKDAIALCKNKTEWLERIHPEDFLVVTDYDIHLEGSVFSDISIPMGTILPLSSASRSSSDMLEYYTVVLPSRDSTGMISDTEVKIPVSSSVNHGYLPYTEDNVRTLALRHEGQIYGNAGSGNAFDCSGMTKSIYACFGFRLPRTAIAQSAIKSAKIYSVHNDFGLGHVFNIGHNTTEYKLSVLADAPVGTLLYFPGHIMLYLGMEDGNPMCISSVADYSTRDLPVGTIENINRTVVTDMSYITRADGQTWLESLEKIIIIE